jgi:hypothetical protein
LNPNTAKKLTRKAVIIGGKTLLAYFDRHKYSGQYNPELSNKMVSNTELKMVEVFKDGLSSVLHEEGSGELVFGKNKIFCYSCDSPYHHWHGIRRFAVGVAWKQNQGLVRGGIFLPVDNELYYFEHDKSSKRNNTKIEMAQPVELKDSFMSVINESGIPNEHEVELGLNLSKAHIRWNFSDGVLYSAALLLNNNLSGIILTDLTSKYLPLLRLMMDCNGGVVEKVKTSGQFGREVYVLCHKVFARGIVEHLSGTMVVHD